MQRAAGTLDAPQAVVESLQFLRGWKGRYFPAELVVGVNQEGTLLS